MDDILRKELIFIGIRSVFLDIAVFLVSFIVSGFSMAVITGLVLGTAVMLIYLAMLYYSLKISLSAEDTRTAKAKMMCGYLLRVLLICILIAASFRFDFISPLGAVIPVFYPKIIHVGGAIFKRKGGV